MIIRGSSQTFILGTPLSKKWSRSREFAVTAKAAPTRQGVLEGLQKLRQQTIDSAEEIRTERGSGH